MKIFKMTLKTTDTQVLQMPNGAKVLSLQVQHGKPQLWILVNENNSTMTQRKFVTHGTGNPINPAVDPSKFVGTYQLDGGNLVFHVFEQI